MAQTTGTVKALGDVSTPGHMLALLSQGFQDGVSKILIRSPSGLAWKSSKADSTKQRLRSDRYLSCLVALVHRTSNLP
jgi:hypothetical protein